MLELLTADDLAEFWPSQSSSMKLSLPTAKGNDLPEDWQRRSRLEANSIWSQRRIHVTSQSSTPELDGPLTDNFRLTDVFVREKWFSVQVYLDKLARGDEK